jgi:hypothetical protein
MIGVGFWSALFLAAFPPFLVLWRDSLPHTLDAFLVILCAWLLLRVRQGEHLIYPWAVISLAIAGGLRPKRWCSCAARIIFSLADRVETPDDCHGDWVCGLPYWFTH